MTYLPPLIEQPRVVPIPPANVVHVTVILDVANVFFLKPGTDDVATVVLTMDLNTLRAFVRDAGIELG